MLTDCNAQDGCLAFLRLPRLSTHRLFDTIPLGAVARQRERMQFIQNFKAMKNNQKKKK